MHKQRINRELGKGKIGTCNRPWIRALAASQISVLQFRMCSSLWFTKKYTDWIISLESIFKYVKWHSAQSITQKNVWRINCGGIARNPPPCSVFLLMPHLSDFPMIFVHCGFWSSASHFYLFVVCLLLPVTIEGHKILMYMPLLWYFPSCLMATFGVPRSNSCCNSRTCAVARAQLCSE